MTPSYVLLIATVGVVLWTLSALVIGLFIAAIRARRAKVDSEAAMNVVGEKWEERFAVVPNYLIIAIPAMAALWIMGM